MRKNNNNKSLTRLTHTDQTLALRQADRFLEEINMLKYEALMFCTSKSEQQKLNKLRQQNPKGKITLEREDRLGTKIKITFDAEFGAPGDVAYRILNAGFYKLSQGFVPTSDDGRHQFPSRLHFGARELFRLSGRQWSGSKEIHQEYYNGLMQLYHTEFSFQWRDRTSGKVAELHFRPLITAFIARDRKAEGQGLSSCIFELHPSIIEGYNTGHFKAFNMQRMIGLRPAGMIIYKRAFLIFGALRNRGIKHIKYEKDYEDLCHEWLVGHTPRRYLSEIKRHIGGHCDDLVTKKFFRKYSVIKKKQGNGYKVVFYPGEAFDEDFSIFYETALAHLPSSPTDDEKGEFDRLDVLAHFHEKCGRTHQRFMEKELTDALKLLKSYSRDDIIDLIDFALVNRAQSITPQVFGFVLGYIDRWEVVKKERMANRALLQNVQERLAAEVCSYCDKSGRLWFYDRQGAYTNKWCPHDLEKIKQRAKEAGYRVPGIEH